VAGSLLHAVGLPELVTSDLGAYQALALKLATEPDVLSSMRNRLKENRLTAPLFDTDRFRRNIESAYTQMWGIWQRGEARRSFAVLRPFSSKAVGTGQAKPVVSLTDTRGLVARAATVFAAGKLDEAEALGRQALDSNASDFDVLHLLGAIAGQRGDLEAGLKFWDKACAIKPYHTELLKNYGIVLGRLTRLQDAMKMYDRAIAIKPDYAEAFYNRGNTLLELKRAEEAIASYDKALAIKPDCADALNNRGNVQRDYLKRYQDALATYDKAIAIRSDFAGAYFNRGLSLHELRRFREGMASYDRALAMRPDYAEAHFNTALVLLLTGDYHRGWAEYEWRWKNESIARSKRNFPQPLWLGADAIAGKTVLLHSEQGLGDAIQFCRYVPMIAARGGHVILEVQKTLHKLMTTLSGAVQVISRGDPLPDFDLHCPLLSLPLAFRTRLETIPAATPYLRALQSIPNWETRLGSRSRPRIGLAWSGNPSHKNDSDRSIALHALLPILDTEATFVSLQKDLRPRDAALLKERRDILDFGDVLKDFADTAALVSHLDLVISVDTSVAHLAGALGKPVWVLLPFIPDWRWLLDRDDSPWYPTARLFRQGETREWKTVTRRVHHEVRHFVESRHII
jgi:tetratricopeptide (TPR) repeat protein